MGKLVILSGPSCAGKGPLVKALEKFYPEQATSMEKLVLFNSRLPRPGEVEGIDYFFRSKREIESLRDERAYLVADVRGDLQAIDLSRLKKNLERSDMFFEGNPIIIDELLKRPDFGPIEKICVFLSPLCRDEIVYLKKECGSDGMRRVIVDVMRRKLLRRTKRQKTNLSLKDLENIEKRAESAPLELEYACRFDVVIPNHDGEDSENWDAFYYPLGDARKVMDCFATLLKGEKSDYTEVWDEGLFE